MIRYDSKSIAPALIAVALAAALAGAGGAYWYLQSRSPPEVKAAGSAARSTHAQENTALAEIKIPAQYLAMADIAVEAVNTGGVDTEILAPGPAFRSQRNRPSRPSRLRARPIALSSAR